MSGSLILCGPTVALVMFSLNGSGKITTGFGSQTCVTCGVFSPPLDKTNKSNLLKCEK